MIFHSFENHGIIEYPEKRLWNWTRRIILILVPHRSTPNSNHTYESVVQMFLQDRFGAVTTVLGSCRKGYSESNSMFKVKERIRIYLSAFWFLFCLFQDVSLKHYQNCSEIETRVVLHPVCLPTHLRQGPEQNGQKHNELAEVKIKLSGFFGGVRYKMRGGWTQVK